MVESCVRVPLVQLLLVKYGDYFYLIPDASEEAIDWLLSFIVSRQNGRNLLKEDIIFQHNKNKPKPKPM